MIKVIWNLPPGEHEASWDEFCKRFGFSRSRKRMIGNMRQMLLGLRDAGCKFVKIDGSFVTSKPEPGDFDGTWDPRGVDRSKLDPIIDFEQKHLMKEKYLGEFFRQSTKVAGTNLTFDDFFQIDRRQSLKGVVKIKLETLK